MLAAIQAVADPDSITVAVQALVDAFASGDIVLACVAGALVVGLFVIKFLGKKVPFVDVAVKIVLDLAKKFFSKKVVAPGVAAVVKPVEDSEQDSDTKPSEGTPDGIGNVVSIKKDQ